MDIWLSPASLLPGRGNKKGAASFGGPRYLPVNRYAGGRSSPSGVCLLLFLCVDDGQRCRVDDVLDVAVSLEHVDGFARPHQDGPDRLGAAQPRHQFEGDVAGFQGGEDEHVRLGLERVEIVGGVQNFGHKGRVRLHFAVDDQVGPARLGDLRRAGHLVRERMARAAEIAERKHRDARFDVQALDRVRGADGDFRKLFRRRFDIDRRIGEENHVLGEDHHVESRDDGSLLLQGKRLQGRPDGVGIVLVHAAHQAVGVAHLHHHGAEVVQVVFHEMA